MALVTYPLNNTDYTAEDAELFHCTRSSGISAADDFDYSITGADNTITIGTGIAWIRNSRFSGKVTALKSDLALDLGLPDAVYPRIDAVMIQFDANLNRTDLTVKQGVPASAPAAPSVSRTEALYELCLYQVYRAAGAAAITPADISDTRISSSLCGLMADAVTSIDLTAIDAQARALIASIRLELASVQDGSAYRLKSEVVPVSDGGTGATTVAAARNALGLGNTSGPLPIANGGTGATTVAAALKAVNDAPGTPAHSMLCYSSLSETAITASSITTENLLIAMPLNSAICFTHRSTDAVCLADAPASYGIVTLTKGSAAAYAVGTFMDNSGNYYVYSRTNGWEKNSMAVSSGSGARNGTNTQSEDFDCTYTRYGRIVVVSFKVTMSSAANGTWSDYLIISGIPAALSATRGTAVRGTDSSDDAAGLAGCASCTVTTTGTIRAVARETSLAGATLIGAVTYIAAA